MCKFRLVFDEHGGNENFQRRFAVELEELKQLSADGLIEIREDRLQVTQLGRLLIRNIAMVFDEWLRRDRRQDDTPKSRFSQTV